MPRNIACLAVALLLPVHASAQARTPAWNDSVRPGVRVVALMTDGQRISGRVLTGTPEALTVNTPLGVLIPYAVRVRVDDGNVAPVPFLRCLQDNCVARAPLAEEAVADFKKGSKATFGFFLQEEILVEISLSGFTAAYDALKPVQANPQN